MSTNLQVGDLVTTDFYGKITQHRIVARKDQTRSQSRVMYRVQPWQTSHWVDAAWFRHIEEIDFKER